MKKSLEIRPSAAWHSIDAVFGHESEGNSLSKGAFRLGEISGVSVLWIGAEAWFA